MFNSVFPLRWYGNRLPVTGRQPVGIFLDGNRLTDRQSGKTKIFFDKVSEENFKQYFQMQTHISFLYFLGI